MEKLGKEFADKLLATYMSKRNVKKTDLSYPLAKISADVFTMGINLLRQSSENQEASETQKEDIP